MRFFPPALASFFFLLCAVLFAPAEAQQPDQRLTPFQPVRMAAQDSGTAPATYWRYLVIPNMPVERRIKMKQTVDFVVNSVSRARRVYKTTALPNDKAPVVLRVDLNAYEIDPTAWDELAEQGSGAVPLPEPYHYVPVEKEVEKIWPGGDYNGKPYPAGQKYKVKKKTIEPGPWIQRPDSNDSVKTLMKNTGYPMAPILRADWFVANASVAPAYYKLLGLKTKESEFEDLLAVDKVRAKKGLISAVADTKLVALHNRILNRFTTVSGLTGGYYWFSFDTDTGIDKEDYLNNLETFDTPAFKAKELIGTLPNTLQAYAVSNAKGELLNLADAKIAHHREALPTKLLDKQIWSGLRNCAFCHYGIQPIQCKVRGIAQNEIGLAQLFTGKIKDLKIQRRVGDAFGVPLEIVVDHDNAIHAAAILTVNGLKPQQNSAQLENFLYEYLDEPVTLETAAREAGLTAEQLETLIKASAGIDHTLVGVAQRPEVPATRVNWERRGFIQLMLAIHAGPQ